MFFWGKVPKNGTRAIRRALNSVYVASKQVRGEGFGVVLLETESGRSSKLAFAFVAGVGVGQDGRSNGLTAPNPVAQLFVLRAAYDRHREEGDASRVALIEAHGTGTRLGDPIELGALGCAKLGGERALRCASIKTNVGHLEGCSRLAGLLKAALVLSRPENAAPKSLHFARPSQVVP